MKQKLPAKYANPIFVLLWLASYIIAFAIPEIIELILKIPLWFGLPTIQPLGIPFLTIFVYTFLTGLSLSAMQKGILFYRYHQEFKAWIFWNTVAWLVYVPVQWYSLYSALNGTSIVGYWWSLFANLMLIMPVASAQAWVLRKSLKQAWLLPLAGLAITGLYSIIGYDSFGYWGLTLHAIAHAVFLLWVFARSSDTEKRKIAAAQDTQDLDDKAEEINEESYKESKMKL